ncbi:MAG: serine/threonine protein phosphatase PrpC [Pseudohongiellaceae bacterium]|jgi:serine/threonine protein phosphatase PrpC
MTFIPETNNRPHMDSCGLRHGDPERTRSSNQFVVAQLNRSLLMHESTLPVPDASTVTSPVSSHLLMVADGGTMDAQATGVATVGEAARGVLESLPSRWPGSSDEEIQDALHELMDNCTRVTQSHDTGRRASMASLTLAYLDGGRLHLGQIGSGRCYALAEGSLIALTVGRSLSDALVQQGALRPEGGTDLGDDDVPLQSPEACEREISSLSLDGTDVLLLASDGLTRHVDDERIAIILARSWDSRSACRSLVGEAVANGAAEDVTAVVLYLTDRQATHRGLMSHGRVRQAHAQVPAHPKSRRTDVPTPTRPERQRHHSVVEPGERLGVTRDAREHLLDGTQQGGPWRLVRVSEGYDLLPGLWRSGDMSYAHAGSTVLLVEGQLARGLDQFDLHVEDGDLQLASRGVTEPDVPVVVERPQQSLEVIS